MSGIPPVRGRRFDPDWSARIALFMVLWFVIAAVMAWFFWNWIVGS